jgi:hypothetical protein
MKRVNRFLLRERYEPKDLFDEVKLKINLVGGTLSGDDTVIDKPHSNPKLTELIDYVYSGRHHRAVKGIQLITLYYTDLSGKSVPVNYRIYNKQEEKTKNDYFRELITEVLDWGLKPKTVTTDAWYSSQKNLKFLKNKQLGFLTGVAKNRLCSVDGKNFTQVQNERNSRSWFSSVSENLWAGKDISQKFQKRNPEILHYIYT